MEQVEKELNGEVYTMGRKYTKEQFINKIKTDDEFAKKWGELGPVYGKQWRNWGHREDTKLVDNNKGNFEYENVITKGVDQITNLINDLKGNPDSRRLMVTAWNPAEVDDCVLPPCHYGFQVWTRELSLEERLTWMKNNKTNVVLPARDLNVEFSIDEFFRPYDVPTRAISLMFNMRSNDVPLGLPFNIASYGLLLEIIGNMVNMVPDELIVNLGDAHIYKNQIDGVKEQLTRTPMKLPNLIISGEVNFNSTIEDFLNSCNKDSFKLDGYESHPSIKIPLSN
jgi:thymidylate synthase